MKMYLINILLFYSIPILDFPMCVIGDQTDVALDNLEIGDNLPYSWRNVFSCINLLRILNKLTKWKHSRIMVYTIFNYYIYFFTMTLTLSIYRC